jgi:NTP pyrophosphatase (non-canonical NTP hydrolase)
MNIAELILNEIASRSRLDAELEAEPMHDLATVANKILAFREERNLGQFHTPRNLAAALAIEVGELQEAMLWKTDEEVQKLLKTLEGGTAVTAEIGDVPIFTVLFCDATGIDPLKAIEEKLIENERKYPVELAKDNAAKHTKLRK